MLENGVENLSCFQVRRIQQCTLLADENRLILGRVVYSSVGTLDQCGIQRYDIRAKRYFALVPAGAIALRRSRSALDSLWEGLELDTDGLA